MIIDSLKLLASLARMQKSRWQIQEAKNRLSELVECSLSNGPQMITKHGKPTAVVVSFEEFKQLNPEAGCPILDWLKNCPGSDLEDWIEPRDKEEIQDLNLT